ncbi:MAG: SDR family oxidoreductase [Bacteroidota bacterium]
MKDKIVLITGATAGIGKETARALAKKGYTLYLHGRNALKGEKVVEEIKKDSGNSNIELLLADLGDLAAVRELANSFKQKETKLDILINNAGYLAKERWMAKSGHESMLTINFLAPFLLSHELLDCLKKAEQGRIVNVSSNAMLDKIVLDNLNSEQKFSQMGTYGHTKSLLTSYTNELARRLADTKVTANSLHPGVVFTQMIKDYAGPAKGLVKFLGSMMFKSPAQGAENSIYVATAPELAAVSGKYFVKKKAVSPKSVTLDPQIAEEVWQKAANMTAIA